MLSPWFVVVYKIYLCLPNIGALADHPSAKEGNSAKWTKKGFEKKENILFTKSTYDTKPTITAPQVVTSCSITTGLATGTAEISIDGFCFLC